MRYIILAIVVVAVTASPVRKDNELQAEREWWKTAIFYQIYPRSFQDSDGDGNGDLNGVRSRLYHLKNLGVTAAWLSPIFTSPMVDAGYDISDFRDINPMFGTMEDFDLFLKEAHALGLKVVLDYVPNHTSDKHVWFEKSIARVDPYTNYYVWSDGKIVNGTRQPPSNWISNFLGSAWTWNSKRGQYYLHQFAKEQPDLNFRDPILVEEMKDVLRFWLDRGVDGFRVDTIPSLFEDDNFPDEPRSNDPNCLPVDYCYLDHIHSRHHPLTFDMVIQWRKVLDEYSNATDKIDRVLMTEGYGPVDVIMGYYGNKTHNGAHFTFNFEFISTATINSSAVDYQTIIQNWMGFLPEGRTSNWVLGNHDKHRVGNRLGIELIDGFNIIAMTLPGVAVTYNGEEFGQLDGFVSWEESEDPKALNAGKDRYLEVTRDPERTPLQWDDTVNAGFSTANKTWLPVSPLYKETNLKQQLEDPESHYNVYRSLVGLRQLEVVQKGDWTVMGWDDILFIYRSFGSDWLLSVINFGNRLKRVELDRLKFLESRGLVFRVAVTSGGAKHKKGSIINLTDLDLQPYEAYVLTKV